MIDMGSYWCVVKVITHCGVDVPTVSHWLPSKPGELCVHSLLLKVHGREAV